MKRLNYDSTDYKRKCKALREQLSSKGIRYALYEMGKPGEDKRVTVCVARLPSGIHVRGYAICSSEDNFCRAVGHYHAMVRALQAAHRERSGEWTLKPEVYSRFDHGDDEILISPAFPLAKSRYAVNVNKHEEELLGDKGGDQCVLT